MQGVSTNNSSPRWYSPGESATSASVSLTDSEIQGI